MHISISTHIVITSIIIIMTIIIIIIAITTTPHNNDNNNNENIISIISIIIMMMIIIIIIIVIICTVAGGWGGWRSLAARRLCALSDSPSFVLYAICMFLVGGVCLKNAIGTGLIISGDIYKYSHPHICIYIYIYIIIIIIIKSAGCITQCAVEVYTEAHVVFLTCYNRLALRNEAFQHVARLDIVSTFTPLRVHPCGGPSVTILYLYVH